MPVLDVGKRITDTLATLIKATGDVLSNTIDVTRVSTVSTLRSIRGGRAETSRVATEAIVAAIRAGYEAGAELGSVTKGAVIGAIQGVGEVTKVTPRILSDAARAAVKETSEVGGDVATAARKAVEGAIEAGKQRGMKGEDAASAGAAGAIAAAGELGEAVASAIAKTLSGTISGVRVVFESPFKKPAVLVLNGNHRDLELLSQQLSKEGYRVQAAGSGKELGEVVQATEGKISLALIDVSDFDEEIWESCDLLRKARIPFLVISPKRSRTIQQESMKHGAGGVLTKPLGVKELAEHIRGLLGD